MRPLHQTPRKDTLSIIDGIADELGVSKKAVREALELRGKFALEKIREGMAYRVRYLGIFKKKKERQFSRSPRKPGEVDSAQTQI